MAGPVKLLGPLFAERRLLLLEDRESCRFDLGLDSHLTSGKWRGSDIDMMTDAQRAPEYGDSATKI